MIDWRVVQRLEEWCEASPKASRTALKVLWSSIADAERRVRRFSMALSDAGISQLGAQLSISSTLMMGVSPEQYPPIRTNRFIDAFERTGFVTFQPGDDAGKRYAHSLAFLDLMREKGQAAGIPFRHRLEAQGAVWCITGVGTTDIAIAEDVLGEDDALSDSEAERLVEEAARHPLTKTEKLALVLSRRGQGRFRDDLFALWGRCAVTSCYDGRLLRASHLKPWKYSTNIERLDPYNGLLLTPQLDLVLDRGLVTFKNDGSVRIATDLEGKDLKCLGIHKRMRLSGVERKHLPYLAYHRKNIFQG